MKRKRSWKEGYNLKSKNQTRVNLKREETKKDHLKREKLTI